MPSPSRAPRGALGGKEGSRSEGGSTGGSLRAPTRVPQGWQELSAVEPGSPRGRRLFVSAPSLFEVQLQFVLASSTF